MLSFTLADIFFSEFNKFSVKRLIIFVVCYKKIIKDVLYAVWDKRQGITAEVRWRSQGEERFRIQRIQWGDSSQMFSARFLMLEHIFLELLGVWGLDFKEEKRLFPFSFSQHLLLTALWCIYVLQLITFSIILSRSIKLFLSHLKYHWHSSFWINIYPIHHFSELVSIVSYKYIMHYSHVFFPSF